MMKQFLAMRQSARLRGCDLLMFQVRPPARHAPASPGVRACHRGLTAR